jgi:hypothetical protein
LNKKSGGWEAHSGDIFNDITYPLAKAVTFLRSEFDRQHNTSKILRRGIRVVFPAIFVSSPIYTVSAGASEPMVETASHVCLERQLSSTSVSGNFRYDVVHVDGIKDWYNDHVLKTIHMVIEEAQIDIYDTGHLEPL